MVFKISRDRKDYLGLLLCVRKGSDLDPFFGALGLSRKRILCACHTSVNNSRRSGTGISQQTLARQHACFHFRISDERPWASRRSHPTVVILPSAHNCTRRRALGLSCWPSLDRGVLRTEREAFPGHKRSEGVIVLNVGAKCSRIRQNLAPDLPLTTYEITGSCSRSAAGPSSWWRTVWP